MWVGFEFHIVFETLSNGLLTTRAESAAVGM